MTILETAHSNGDLPSASGSVPSAGPEDVPMAFKADETRQSMSETRGQPASRGLPGTRFYHSHYPF